MPRRTRHDLRPASRLRELGRDLLVGERARAPSVPRTRLCVGVRDQGTRDRGMGRAPLACSRSPDHRRAGERMTELDAATIEGDQACRLGRREQGWVEAAELDPARDRRDVTPGCQGRHEEDGLCVRRQAVQSSDEHLGRASPGDDAVRQALGARELPRREENPQLDERERVASGLLSKSQRDVVIDRRAVVAAEQLARCRCVETDDLEPL